jgi:DNA replication protein DnaC
VQAETVGHGLLVVADNRRRGSAVRTGRRLLRRRAGLTHAAFLERLLAVEAAAVDERRRASLERFASLPSPFTLADFDFSAQPSVGPKLIADLGTLRFIDDIYW